MRKFAVLIMCLVVAITCWACGTNQKIDYSVDMSPRLLKASSSATAEEVVKIVEPAVVGVLCKSASGESVGSGVAVASDGYILTNQHVVDGATQVYVYFANKENTRASIVWTDKALDLAVIKSEKSLPYLEMSTSANLSSGQDVLAVGTPLSLQFARTVTKGIVSALNRTIETDSGSTSQVSYLQNLIQHDASINPGNSGGPLINLSGQVVGINTLKATDAEGIGFAIPIEVSLPVIEKIKMNGKFETPYIGIYGFDATIATFYGKTATENGVYVTSLDESGPASKTGIKVGDIITKIDESDIKTMLDLRKTIYSKDIGTVAKIDVKRNGEIITLSMNITKRA